MKDNWTKPFQDKLGEYELDLPQPAARPRMRLILPLLAGAAAAAALLLLFLPAPSSRDSATGTGLRDGRMIAEVPAALSIDIPESPAPVTMPLRQLRKDSFLPENGLQETLVAAEDAGADAAGTDAVEPAEEVEAAEVQGPSITVSGNEEPVEKAVWPYEEEPQRKSGFSARLHFSPGSIGEKDSFNGGIVNGTKDFAIGLESMDDRSISTSPQSNSYYALAVNNYKNTNEIESTICYLPMKFGLSFRWQVADRFALESGLGYDLQRSRIHYVKSLIPDYPQELRMHYIGIPLKGIFTLAGWDRLNIYASAGAEAEFMAAGTILSKASEEVISKQRIEEHPMLFSITGAAGAEYSFTPRLGIYAEPGIARHFVQSTDLPLYYKEHPLSFDLHVGLRFNL